MYQYRLECECGYVSNSAPFGSSMGSPSHYVPVVVDGTDTLQTLEIVKLENETEDDFCERLDNTIESAAVETFGENLTVMTPSAIRAEQVARCPKCKEERAKFVFAGF